MCDFRLALALPLPVDIGSLSRETGVAFAGEKWAFLVQFSGAEVMAVSVKSRVLCRDV